MATRVDTDHPLLTLGWQVTTFQDPRYWMSTGAKAGAQDSNDLVQVMPAHLANHTVIVAQSGSGKSYFLGRIIEEIMLRTRARCVVFDPNADFRRVNEVEDSSLWAQASYDSFERKGRLPHEGTREEFASIWAEVPIRIRSGSGARQQQTSSDVHEQLKLWWPTLSMAFIAEELDPMLRSDLYHCHAFIKSLAQFSRIKYLATNKNLNLIEEAQKIFRLARGLEKPDFRLNLQQEFDIAPIVNKMKPFDFDSSDAQSSDFFSVGDLDSSFMIITKSWLENSRDALIELALTLNEYVTSDVERFYFGKAREYLAANIIEANLNAEPSSRSVRLDVIDLPSLPDPNTKLLAINAILTTEWERVRFAWSRALDRPANQDRRMPTFIIIDEAHNLIPSDPRGKPAVVLREQFRTVAAEGRKYGLFLILVSQRPDKLDPLIVSECENKAVMRIGSASVLGITREMLGLDDLAPKLIEKCLEFETGRALLIGRWAAGGAQIIYSAARRTVEGGRNLRAESWGRPSVNVARATSKRPRTRKPQTAKSGLSRQRKSAKKK